MKCWKVFVLIGWTILVSGCAAVDNITRTQPSTGFSSALVEDPQKPGNRTLAFGIVLYSIEFNGKTVHSVPENEGLGSELFLTADVSSVLKQGLTSSAITGDDERKLIRFLIYVSDHNATIWMNRVYALNKARHGLVNGLKDLTASGSGLAAFLSPPASASLGAASLLIGTASNEIDEYAYSGKTVETLLKGIQASRAVQYKVIQDQLNQSDLSKYDIYTALDDVKLYDSLISFRKGLEYLAQLADATSNSAKTADSQPPSGQTPNASTTSGQPTGGQTSGQSTGKSASKGVIVTSPVPLKD